MNSSVSHYLPKITKLNESANLKHKGSLNTERYNRTQSTSEINSSVPLTRKLVSMDDIRNVE